MRFTFIFPVLSPIPWPVPVWSLAACRVKPQQYVNRLSELYRLYLTVQTRWCLCGWIVIMMTGWDKFWFLLRYYLSIWAMSTSIDLIYPYWMALVTEHQFIQQIPFIGAWTSSCLLKTHCMLLFLCNTFWVLEQVLYLKSSPCWRSLLKTRKSQVMQHFSSCCPTTKNCLATAGFSQGPPGRVPRYCPHSCPPRVEGVAHAAHHGSATGWVQSRDHGVDH